MGMNRHPTRDERSAGALLMRLGRSATTGRAPLAPFANYAVLCSYVVLLGLSYYLAARLGLRFRFHNSQIGVVWPANAIFLSALLLTPRKRWWVALTATALAHAAAVAPLVPVWRLLWQIAFNSVFAIATVEVLRRSPGLPLQFESRRQVLAYTAISFVLPWLFGFTTPSFVLSALHVESAITPTFAVLRTMLSSSTAM